MSSGGDSSSIECTKPAAVPLHADGADSTSGIASYHKRGDISNEGTGAIRAQADHRPQDNGKSRCSASRSRAAGAPVVGPVAGLLNKINYRDGKSWYSASSSRVAGTPAVGPVAGLSDNISYNQGAMDKAGLDAYVRSLTRSVLEGKKPRPRVDNPEALDFMYSKSNAKTFDDCKGRTLAQAQKPGRKSFAVSEAELQQLLKDERFAARWDKARTSRVFKSLHHFGGLEEFGLDEAIEQACKSEGLKVKCIGHDNKRAGAKVHLLDKEPYGIELADARQGKVD